VAHTSAAAPATFAQGRSANPTYWRQSEWTASAANLTTPATMAWNAAIDACLALSYAGCDDWRLPNWLELASLYDCSRTGIPLIDQACFPNTVAAQCWSSTTQPYSSSTYAQFVHWAAGYIAISSAIKTTAYYVRPVRGGRTHV
jgi:hypothetical protein